MKHLFTVYLIIFLSLNLYSNNNYEKPDPYSNANTESLKPTIVVAHPLLADWLKNLTQGALTVENLMPPGMDPHTFEPSPQQARLLAQADWVIGLHPELDPWLKHFSTSICTKANYAFLSDFIRFDANEDPHIWMDPKNVIQLIKAIKTKLCKSYPQFEYILNKNESLYVKQLADLDTWIHEQVGILPQARRKLVTYHKSFLHFAKAYHFKIVGSILNTANTDAAEPSARYFLNLIKLIKAEQVPIIFGEVHHNPKLVIALAKEAHLPPPYWLYADTLDDTVDTYIKLMQYNAQTIVNGLMHDRLSVQK